MMSSFDIHIHIHPKRIDHRTKKYKFFWKDIGFDDDVNFCVKMYVAGGTEVRSFD